MSGREKRLSELEAAANGPSGRIRYMLRWGSQDPEETRRRWEQSLLNRGDPLLATDQVYCVVFKDPAGAHADDWSRLEAPSWRGEPRRAA